MHTYIQTDIRTYRHTHIHYSSHYITLNYITLLTYIHMISTSMHRIIIRRPFNAVKMPTSAAFSPGPSWKPHARHGASSATWSVSCASASAKVRKATARKRWCRTDRRRSGSWAKGWGKWIEKYGKWWGNTNNKPIPNYGILSQK